MFVTHRQNHYVRQIVYWRHRMYKCQIREQDFPFIIEFTIMLSKCDITNINCQKYHSNPTDSKKTQQKQNTKLNKHKGNSSVIRLFNSDKPIKIKQIRFKNQN